MDYHGASAISQNLGKLVLPAFFNPQAASIGTVLAPKAIVLSKSGTCRKHKFSNFKRSGLDTRRASGDQPVRNYFEAAEFEWNCKRYSEYDTIDLDDADYEGFDLGIEQADSVELLSNDLGREHEVRVISLFSSMTYTSSPTVKWNAGASTTIRADLQTGIESIVDETEGTVRPNFIGMDYKIMHALMNAPELTDLLGGASKPDEISETMVRGFLAAYGLTKVHLSLTGEFGENVVLAYVPDGEIKSLKNTFSTFVTPCVGTAPKVRIVDDAPVRKVKVQIEVDQALLHDECGYLFTNTLA